jgi:hypothetical protein
MLPVQGVSMLDNCHPNWNVEAPWLMYQARNRHGRTKETKDTWIRWECEYRLTFLSKCIGSMYNLHFFIVWLYGIICGRCKTWRFSAMRAIIEIGNPQQQLKASLLQSDVIITTSIVPRPSQQDLAFGHFSRSFSGSNRRKWRLCLVENNCEFWNGCMLEML